MTQAHKLYLPAYTEVHFCQFQLREFGSLSIIFIRTDYHLCFRQPSAWQRFNIIQLICSGIKNIALLYWTKLCFACKFARPKKFLMTAKTFFLMRKVFVITITTILKHYTTSKYHLQIPQCKLYNIQISTPTVEGWGTSESNF